MTTQNLVAERRQEVTRLYTVEDKTIRAIAKHLGLGYGTVHRDLTLSGVVLRSRGVRGPVVPGPRPQFDKNGKCSSCGYTRSASADDSCQWPAKHQPASTV
jgi:hypothetical protein